ncbi:uncharacterized protein PFL1_02324 [Pseudozyma flocculosa PF-1]|uniref:uncharacterized protein n=1 Tax=Pseudozyma flocculosa PF-1 TaxID=1277687 RepID=UPI0004560774|nr:uncharacterized protein PFL1_02324 [Pseudozyma flocculosa PF-1]EPQ30208.1 hypothetical protein PFL1_02324 [Pseudozyma flocculosa PF-1]
MSYIPQLSKLPDVESHHIHDPTASSSSPYATPKLEEDKIFPQPRSVQSDSGEKRTHPLEGIRQPSGSSATLSDVHIFQDEAIAAHWKGVYERSSYEGRHRFDPSFEWTPEEDRQLLKKVDLRVTCWSWAMFLALDLVRKNISRALADNFLADLGMSLNDYNNGLLVFLLCFLFAELPSGLVSKKVGADRWVPTQIVSWSIIGAAQAAITGKAGFLVTRALLGLTMGGFLPDQLLYLSYFYTSKELSTRVGWFYTVIGISQVLGSLLAAGFLELRGLNGLAGWRYLFAFEGLIAGVIGLMAFFLMPNSPTATKGRFFSKRGWFSEREEKIIVNKILRDDPSKGDMNNRQGVSPRELWRALCEKDLWPIYLMGLVVFIPWQPPTLIISLLLKQMGYNTLRSNLLAIPGQVLFSINSVLLTWLSVRTNERGLVSSIANFWTLPFLVALYCLPEKVSMHLAWVRYALITCITAVPYCHPILIGWVSQNSHSVRNRTVSLCLYNMMVQVSTILATRVYMTNDRPFYNKGNLALIIISAVAILQAWLTKAYYVWRNRQKQAVWSAMSHEQQTPQS